VERNLLLPPERVFTSPYYKTWRREFRLAGFLLVTPYTAPPPHDTWTKVPYNRFCAIAHEALVDGREAFIVPAFVNDDILPAQVFDGDKDASVNDTKPWMIFFLGNDDWHYGMRFETRALRDGMLKTFGEDLGFLEEELIGHN